MSTGKKGGIDTPTPTTPTPRLSPKKAAQLRRQQARRRKKFITWLVITVAMVIVAAGIIVFLLSPNNSRSNIAGVVSYSNLSQGHVNGTVNYPQSPPVGGDHNAVWQNCGVYDKPVANENAVHSMEHGAVWITYQPDLAASTVEQLRNMVRGHSYVLLTPYPGLDSPVVATAWGLQLKLNDANDPRLAQFMTNYEQGPQTPERGAVCNGGLGTPIG